MVVNDSGCRCYLLGAPRIERGGQPIDIPRRQTRALFFYLATQGQLVQRGKLGFIFWPDIPEASARRNLSRLLNQLQNSLGKNVLSRSQDGIGLQMNGIWTDIGEFRTSIQKGDREHAIALYAGQFLEGFSLPDSPEFEHWAITEANQMERFYLECLEAVIQEYADQGRFKEGIEMAHRYLQIDQLAEPIHRRLIELYAVSGDRAAAIKQYEECLLILDRELGVDTLPETKDVVQALLSGQLSDTFQSQPMPIPPDHSPTEMPFVGRSEVLNILFRSVERATENQGQMVLIIGEAGIGKTCVLQNFINQVQGQVKVLQASADPGMQNLPYSLIARALRSGLETGLTPQLQQPSQVAEITRLLPELNDLYDNLPETLPLDSEGAQLRLFDALCQFVLNWVYAEGSLLLLSLDDLHWADATSLQWLAYFGSQIHHHPILVVGTCRPEDEPILQELRLGLARQGLLSRVQLEGLKFSDVELALNTIDLPWAGNSEWVTRMWQISAGNPFFLKEILHGLIETGRDWSSLDDQGIPLPESIIQAVYRRLNLMSEVARQVLDAAAVIGKQFSFEIVRQTSGRSPEETGAALDELVIRKVLIEQGRDYAFQHEILQMTVYNALTYWRRRLLHQRAAQALMNLEPQNHARLSWHFEKAGELHRAAQEAIQAGVAIKRIFAYQEGLQHFNHALNLLEENASHLNGAEDWESNWRLRLLALRERGWVYRLLGNMQAYEQDLREETQLVEKLGDTAARVRLHFRESALLRWWCRYDQALETAHEGLLLNREVGDEWLEVLGLREIGLAHREKGEYDAALTALERALARIETLDDVSMLIHVLGNLSSLFANQNDFERATSYAHRALEICDQQALIYERRLPLGDLGVAAAGKGETAQARAWLNESLEIARQIDDRTQEIFCLTHLGWVALREKDIAQALENLTTALDLAEQINSCAEQSRLHIHFAEMYLLQRDDEQACSHAEQAFELAQSQTRGSESQISHKLLGEICKED